MAERLTYTIEESARLLGIGRGTAYAAARAGELPTVRLGRRLLVPRRALLTLLGDVESTASNAASDSGFLGAMAGALGPGREKNRTGHATSNREVA